VTYGGTPSAMDSDLNDASIDAGMPAQPETGYCSFRCIAERQCLYHCSAIEFPADDEAQGEAACNAQFLATCGYEPGSEEVLGAITDFSIFECGVQGGEDDSCACEYRQPGVPDPDTGFVVSNVNCLTVGDENGVVELSQIETCQEDGTLSIERCGDGLRCVRNPDMESYSCQ